MKKFRKVLLLPVLLFSFIFSVPVYAEDQSQKDISRVYEVMQLINQFHLSAQKEGDLANSAIDGMVKSLGDPYTEYFSQADAAAFMELINGQSLRLGLAFSLREGGIYVTDVWEGSSAEKAGIQAEDKMERVNGTAITSENAAAVLKTASQGKKEGDTVNVTILRGSVTKDFTLTYQKLNVPEVEAAKLDDGVGYLRLHMFTETADTEFSKAFDKLKTAGLKSLIIDLRDNGGGSVETAKQIASLFIRNGTFMYTRDAVSGQKEVRIDNGAGVSFPVYILVNENTASASEMLAGALQDHRIAKVVGTVTYGKGVMQQLFPITDGGGMLKVTTDEYYTPLHHKVDKIGIKPDVTVEAEVPQLFKAMRLAGVKKMDLRIQKSAVSLNGTDVYEEIPTIHQQDRYYVPSRTLAAMEDAGIKWDAAAGAVILDKNGVSASFSLASKSLMLQDGTSYIDLNRFKEQFPDFDWKSQGDKLFLTAH